MTGASSAAATEPAIVDFPEPDGPSTPIRRTPSTSLACAARAIIATMAPRS